MKALRLSCRHLENFEGILKPLFDNFRLLASPKALYDLDISKRIDLFSPWVEHVTFRPSVCDIKIESTQCQRSEEHSTSSAVIQLLDTEVSRYEADDSDEDEDARDSIDSPQNATDAAQKEPRSFSVAAVWTKILKRFQRRHVFTIARCTCTEDKDTGHECHYSFVGLNGSPIFAPAVRSLHLSQTVISHLRIKFYAVGILHWRHVPAWQVMDISQLKGLVLLPQWKVDTPDISRVPAAVTAILNRCQEHLRELAVVPGRPMFFPGDSQIILPSLRTLILEPVADAGLKNLQQLISSAAQLSDLEIRSTTIYPSLGWWRLFTAIREHPNRMQAYLSLIVDKRYNRISYSFHTYTGTSLKPAETSVSDFNIKLSGYLAGVNDWDSTLQEWYAI